eukprot:1875462-Amphidinium_carterae.1
MWRRNPLHQCRSKYVDRLTWNLESHVPSKGVWVRHQCHYVTYDLPSSRAAPAQVSCKTCSAQNRVS